MKEDELRAFNALRKGELTPLASILRTGRRLHPMIARALADLIDGPATATDYRLTTVRHPELKRVTDGRGHRSKEAMRSMAVAITVADSGGLDAGQFESAIAAAMEQHQLSRATVTTMWARNKRTIRFHRRRSRGDKPLS